jgi:sugar-specific transcriptional regulator TrmB
MRVAELDEFLSRAVDRQIAEQRALREAFVELADQVRALQSEQGDDVDPEELLEQIRRIHQAYSDVVVAEVREIRDAIAAAAQAEADEETVDPEEVIEQIRRISQAYSDAVIAEVRDVKEAIAAPPDPSTTEEIDPQEFIEQIRRFSQAYSDAVIAEIREVRETMAAPPAPVAPAPAAPAATDEIAAEIREIREALASQAQATQALATQARERPPVPMPPVAETREVDPDEIVDQIRRISQAYSDAVIAEIREVREGFASMAAPVTAPASDGTDVIAEIRDVRDEILTQLQRPAPPDVTGDAAALGDIHGTVGAMSADVEGIAQALIDLNAGLRDWAEGVDSRIGDMQHAVDLVRDFASQTQELRAEMLEAMDLRDQRQGYVDEGYPSQGSEDEAYEDRAQSQELAPPEPAFDAELVPPPRVMVTDSVEIDRRIQETIDLSLYLADQVDAFGRVLQAMGDLPTRLEGVISQALRRTLTARSKLDSEATTEIRTALASLDTYVDKIDDIVTRFAASEESVRKLALGQVEVNSRIDSLHDAIADRLDDVEADRRRTEEILAAAIDAVGEGKAPKAASTLAKATKSAASRRKPAGTSRRTPAKAKKPKPPARKRTPRKQADT